MLSSVYFLCHNNLGIQKHVLVVHKALCNIQPLNRSSCDNVKVILMEVSQIHTYECYMMHNFFFIIVINNGQINEVQSSCSKSNSQHNTNNSKLIFCIQISSFPDTSCTSSRSSVCHEQNDTEYGGLVK